MSAEIKDGGPAFPRAGFISHGYCGSEKVNCEPQAGMTLRDWFAGQALNGCQRPSSDGSEYPDAKALAKAAYEVADAMLAAREGGEV